MSCEESTVLEILQTLIRMRSCEPGWDELDIVRYIESLFAPYDVYKTVIQHGHNRASLIVAINGKENHDRTVAMMGHIDTMPPYNPQDWLYGPFSGVCVDGAVYGIGSSNSKSGVAAMLAAALSVLREGIKANNNILLCFTADSDGKGMGAKMLLQGGFLPNVSEIVFCDPTGADIGVAQKGVIWIDLDIVGHGRHTMEADQAINALDGVLRFSEKLAAKLNKIKSHHILGKCTATLTQVNTHDNAIWMIPGHVSTRMDVRITPSVDIEHVCEIISDTKKYIEKSQPGIVVNVNIINKRPPVGVATDAPIVCRFERIFSRHGRKPKLVGQSFYTDASNVVPELGIPFVVIGPGGKIFNDREDEHVLLNDVVFASSVYLDYMLGVGDK